MAALCTHSTALIQLHVAKLSTCHCILEFHECTQALCRKLGAYLQWFAFFHFKSNSVLWWEPCLLSVLHEQDVNCSIFIY